MAWIILSEAQDLLLGLLRTNFVTSNLLPMHGNLQTRIVEFPVEGTGVEGPSNVVGYESRPAGAGSYPGVIVVQEWWGLNDHIRSICDRLAHEGFVTIAPDLYQGKTTTDPTLASAWMASLGSEHAMRILEGAIKFLQEKEPLYAEHIGVVGFCMGGSLALALACRTSALKAAVPFYGDLPEPIEQIKNIKCPVLFFAGGKDPWINSEKVSRLKQAFHQYGIHGEIRVYPDADHAFFNDTRREVYNSAAAQDAWMRAIGLLSRTLKS